MLPLQLSNKTGPTAMVLHSGTQLLQKLHAVCAQKLCAARQAMEANRRSC